jgi:hypothetical protein
VDNKPALAFLERNTSRTYFFAALMRQLVAIAFTVIDASILAADAAARPGYNLSQRSLVPTALLKRQRRGHAETPVRSQAPLTACANL